MAGESVNISCGRAFAHTDIIAAVTRRLGHDSGMSIGAGDFVTRGAPLDITKARDRLGFGPRYDNIDDGIASYHDWLKSLG